jgi:hypothetical protein
MITVRIVGDVALRGAELEAARQAALLSLQSEGIRTVAQVTAARNNYVAAKRSAQCDHQDRLVPCAWIRAHAAAAEMLSTSLDDIDLMLSLHHG